MAEPTPEIDGSTEAVLQTLENPTRSVEQWRLAILEAEVLAFDSDQIERLKPLLREYIERNRDSGEPRELVSVGAAIRKYVGLLSTVELSGLAFILEAGHRAAVSPEVELEVVKMVVRKLTAVLLEEGAAFAELGDLLMDLARTYLNPRLLPRQHYGAIAVNAVLALVLARSNHLPELFERLANLEVGWFEELLIRRARALGDELERRFSEASRSERDSLTALLDAVQAAPI